MARICVIFNPAARGEKALRFRAHLNRLSHQCTLKPTTAVGSGQTLAAEAVREGFESVVAAGGDGTVNEVLNGIGDEPDGYTRVRLGVLPLGTVNVFAKELGMPTNFAAAWAILQRGVETSIDLPGRTRLSCHVEGSIAGLPPARFTFRSQQRRVVSPCAVAHEPVLPQ